MPAGSSGAMAFVRHNPGWGRLFSDVAQFSVMDFSVMRHELLMLLQVIQINSLVHKARLGWGHLLLVAYLE